MNLSDSHREAILQLGNTPSGDDFLMTDVIEELLSLGLVYWRATDNLDFTPVGERVFKELDAK
jgi:hypothetical protein